MNPLLSKILTPTALRAYEKQKKDIIDQKKQPANRHRVLLHLRLQKDGRYIRRKYTAAVPNWKPGDASFMLGKEPIVMNWSHLSQDKAALIDRPDYISITSPVKGGTYFDNIITMQVYVRVGEVFYHPFFLEVGAESVDSVLIGVVNNVQYFMAQARRIGRCLRFVGGGYRKLRPAEANRLRRKRYLED